MGRRILVVPDKFKGTLTARQAAQAIAAGWRKIYPRDELDLLPMTDGGDGFGNVMGELIGARRRTVLTMDAAHRPLRADWWWDGNCRTAIIESAEVIGLRLLPWRKFHPFQLDTFGLGKLLHRAEQAKECLIGIGGSATNDGGFGLARSLGWVFFDHQQRTIREWWQLSKLTRVKPPSRRLAVQLTVAVDVRNPLLGAKGCTRVYGPQKGLREEDFAHAERCLRRLAVVLREEHGIAAAKIPGAGAAGGLGFGLMAFAGAEVQSGFSLFAKHARLEERVQAAQLVITGEGAMDEQTHMGKGVGQIARLAARSGVACVALAGTVHPVLRAGKLFAGIRELTEIAPLERAKQQAARCLMELTRRMAGGCAGLGNR